MQRVSCDETVKYEQKLINEIKRIFQSNDVPIVLIKYSLDV